ncbi:MAG: nucleotidyltransferase family protein [Nitrospira sp.]|nr:nucleotidyltransferase family protein [Nitrospira sp.]
MTVAGLLMAAGRSRRFGEANKLLAIFEGRPLVTHAASRLRAVTDNQLAVVRSREVAAVLPFGYEIIVSDKPSAGFGDNIAKGAALAKHQQANKLLITLGDMPKISGLHLRQLISAAGANLPAATCWAGRAVVPACFPAAWFDRLIACHGERGASFLINELPKDQLLPVNTLQYIDVDTPEDLLGNNSQ